MLTIHNNVSVIGISGNKNLNYVLQQLSFLRAGIFFTVGKYHLILQPMANKYCICTHFPFLYKPLFCSSLALSFLLFSWTQ